MLITDSLQRPLKYVIMRIPAIVLCIIASISSAQTFHHVQHTNGSSTYGNTIVDVVPDNSNTATLNGCSGGLWYVIAKGASVANKYTFSFINRLTIFVLGFPVL